MIDMTRCESVEMCLDQISARIRMAGNEEVGWVLAHGMRVEGWSHQSPPTRQQLDSASGNRPVVVWSFDHHMIAASSASLESAGIRRGTPDPNGGYIERDAAGDPTGLVLERAAHIVWDAVPEPKSDHRRRHVVDAMELLASHGFTEVHDLHAPVWLGPMLGEMDRTSGIPLRVRLFPPVAELAKIASEVDAWQTDRVTLGGGKLFADGTLNSRTAWMLQPFKCPIAGHECGTPMYTVEQIDEAIRVCDRLDLPLATHAIGDGAVRAMLDAIERVRPKSQGQRIEHAELIDEQDVPRFAQLGVICSPQPCHLLTDIEALEKYLPHRLERVLPLREIIDSGCTPGELLVFGSDAPIVRPHPEDSIRAAVYRSRVSEPDRTIAPDQAVSEAEAWAAFGAVG